MRIFRKMKNAIMNPKETAKLNKWRKRFEEAKSMYTNELKNMNEYDKLYGGDRYVNINPNKGEGKAKKQSLNVRNIVYELIESQVNSSIPMPKVTPIHKEDEELARRIEVALENEIRLLHFASINDKQERTVPVQGGDFLHVQWDNTKGFHCTLGGLSVSERHPRRVIPQPGVTEIEEMDYIFIMVPQTKEFVKKKYNIDVSRAVDSESNLRESEERDVNEDIVTVIQCYYRNGDGNIGLFTWCEEYILEDFEDYQARRLTRCTKCGRVKSGDTCECGSKIFKDTTEEYEELTENLKMFNGNVINAVSSRIEPVIGENGEESFDENGEPIFQAVEVRTKIPYYKPNEIPLILRRNVSRDGKLLGFSDVAVVSDQQDAIKKIGSKMQEKILKGGSIVTLPEGRNITTSDEEMKIVRLKSPNEKNLIDVLNIQGDVTMDRIMLETNYDWAKSTLGITDAYQGKYDSSATSGTAKQYSINQAAGRLESKSIMKNTAYSRLYEMMFKHMLAYADEPIPLSHRNNTGSYEYAHFNRYDFLRQDAAGEFYWDDEFIFDVDPTSTVMMNREAMWSQIDLKYQAGAFGPIGEDKTLLAYWTFMEQNDYPNSAQMKKIFAERVQQAEEQAHMLRQMGGVGNVMPQM